MGWLFSDRKLRHDTPAQYFTLEFTHETTMSRSTVIATATVRGTVYMAIHKRDTETGKSHVFAAVILFKNNDRDGFGYNDQDETMGPYEVDCPDRIMRLLSPIKDIANSRHAADWRERVRARGASRASSAVKAHELMPGDVLRLPHAVSLGRTGVDSEHFCYVGKIARTLVFTPVARPDLRCRLRRETLACAEVERG